MRIHDESAAPTEALELLKKTAFADTGGSQAARSFLFWLAGQIDPTGYRGDGGMEIRRFDERHRRAALAVLDWWTGSRKSDQPLYDILDELLVRFEPAQPKVIGALEKLEQAQGLVNDAATEMCSVEGYADQWSDLTVLYRQVKDHWHTVNNRREELQRQAEEVQS